MSRRSFSAGGLASRLFFFSAPATTSTYTLSLHDALPISWPHIYSNRRKWDLTNGEDLATPRDRKSTRLNSSHTVISYAVFCLKKKNNTRNQPDLCLPAGSPP